MDNRQFDRMIKEKLLDHESAVPADIWERISDGQHRRRSGWLLRLCMLTSILVVLGTATVWFATTAPSKTKTAHSKTKDHTTYEISTIKHSIAPQPNQQHNNEFSNVKPKRNNAVQLHAHSSLHKGIRKYKVQKTKATAYNNRHKVRQTNNSGGKANLPPDVPVNNTNNAASSLPAGANNTTELPPGIKPQHWQDSTDNTVEKTVDEPDRLSLEVFVSPNLALNYISAADRAYEQVLKNSMRSQTSYTAGLRFGYAFSERIHLKIGVQYAVVSTSGTYKDSALITQNSHNKYRFISVPLLAGYRTKLTGDLQWGFNAGVVVNIYSRYQGLIPLNTGGFADVSKEPVYRTNAQAALYLGADFSKHIKDRTDLFLEPWIMRRTRNMAERFYGFEQRIHTAGLSLGVRYQLYKDGKH